MFVARDLQLKLSMRPALLLLLLTLFLAAGLLLSAQEGFLSGGCAGDIERFCKSEPQTEGKVLQCLFAHERDLTSDCRLEIEQLRPELKAERSRVNRTLASKDDALKKACGIEIQKHCPGNLDGLERTACLNKHRDELTNGCASFLDDLRKNIGGP